MSVLLKEDKTARPSILVGLLALNVVSVYALAKRLFDQTLTPSR